MQMTCCHCYLLLLAGLAALALALAEDTNELGNAVDIDAPHDDKRGWHDLGHAYGKRAGWHDLQTSWGKRDNDADEQEKRGWHDLDTAFGKRGWRDLNTAFGKRGWRDLNTAFGKRGWRDLRMAFGKRDAVDTAEDQLVADEEKRGWHDLNTAFGKRGWRSLNSAFGKRGDNSAAIIEDLITEQLFDDIDSDGDKCIDRKELRLLVKKLLAGEL
ncbi:PREDICTED: prothoracicostatic peptide-like [Priapulus caudatus]|uniref:Prothoracicostatic peptide-like n=1 Tax=Priapulus caudatus TaxID=37621 RepID=A0ABM1DTU1_PRICU|nr:PREDICTED: prothoracicostatic peptide-like [Priapulus caudatus]XP_014663363.1 PREDICTED: prothoracicostatic peptide-like [Priapulus caudatus]